MLSLSFWRDEEAVKAWRNTEEHRQAQKAGRGGIFAGYRLRIAHVVRDYGMTERAEAPPTAGRCTTPDMKSGCCAEHLG